MATEWFEVQTAHQHQPTPTTAHAHTATPTTTNHHQPPHTRAHRPFPPPTPPSPTLSRLWSAMIMSNRLALKGVRTRDMPRAAATAAGAEWWAGRRGNERCDLKPRCAPSRTACCCVSGGPRPARARPANNRQQALTVGHRVDVGGVGEAHSGHPAAVGV